MAINTFPSLRHLSIVSRQGYTSPPASFIRDGWDTLQSVRMTGIEPYGIFITLNESMWPSLGAFKCSECEIGDVEVEALARRCPNLVELDVSCCPNITGVGVKAIVSKEGKRLERLNLTHCVGVSADAVQWARERGVQVVYSFPDAKSRKSSRRM